MAHTTTKASTQKIGNDRLKLPLQLQFSILALIISS